MMVFGKSQQWNIHFQYTDNKTYTNPCNYFTNENRLFESRRNCSAEPGRYKQYKNNPEGFHMVN